MTEVTKSSDEILTELFDSFKAENPVDVSDNSVTPKSPKDESSRSKKKRKKDKKHKSEEKDKHRKKKKCKRHKKKESSNQSDKSNRPKKKKKRKYSSDSYDSEAESKQNTKVVNVEISNKENNLPEEKKISEVAVSQISSVVNNFAVACDTSSIPLPPSVGDTILTQKLAQEVTELKKPQVSEVFEKHAENVGKPTKKLFLQGLDKPKMSIKIGNLKNSQVLEAAEEAKIKADKYEEGEITDETSEESTKLLIKTEMETTSENGSIDSKKQKLHSEQKKCKKRMKSSDSSNLNSLTSSGDKSDEHKNIISEGSNGLQIINETFSLGENLEKRNDENESSRKNTISDNKNQLKLKKLRQLRERKLDNSSSEDEYVSNAKSHSSKSTKEDNKKAVSKSRKRSNKQNSTTDSDRSSSSSESSSSLERNKTSKSKEQTTVLKDIKYSSRTAINSVSRKNHSPKSKHRKSKSRDRSVSEDKHSRPKGKKTRSSSRSEIRKSRSVSKSRIRNSRSQSRYYNRKSRTASRSRQRKSLSRSRDRKSRSVSHSRSRAKRSRSRSRLRRSRTPKKYARKSRSVSKPKKSPSPRRTKTKKSRSLSRAKTRRSSSLSASRGRRSRSIKRKSRSRGRKSSRSPSRLLSSKSARRSSSRSNIRSLSRNRSGSKSRHSRSENRRSRSKNERSSKRRSRSRESQSRSKQSSVKNAKGNKERSARSSSSKHSKLSDSDSEKSESDSKYKGSSKKKKSKDKKSNSKKHKSKHKDINSRLLALSSTKVESSSEDSSSDSESGNSDNRKKSNKVRNSSKDTLTNDDKKSKMGKSKKDLKGKKGKDKIDSIDLTKSKKDVGSAEDSDSLKPKINLKQKIHYSLIDDDPIAMTESEMKILNAKNKLLSKTTNPVSVSSVDSSTKNLSEKEGKNKDFSITKRSKSKQESKPLDLDVLKNTSVKPKLEDQLKKLRTDDSPKKLLKEKSEDLFKNAKDIEISLSKSKNEDIDKTEEQNNLEILDKNTNFSDKLSNVKIKNYLKEDAKDSEPEMELPPTVNSYDSDGQRSDTAMRNMFFGSKSSSNSPDHENEISTKRGSSHSSGESESESDNEKTFFGISKDKVENTLESSSKTELLVKVRSHSSASNNSSIDKNITDSEEELTYRKKQIISDSDENSVLTNKKDFPSEKPSHSIKDHLKVENCNILNVEPDNSDVSGIKVPVKSIESTKEPNLSLIASNNPSLIKGPSTIYNDKKNEILSDLSPKRTNSQDFLYDYEKSEIEDEKLDFDEDKSSESDVTLPSRIKEDVEDLNQKEKSDHTSLVTIVSTEVDMDKVNISKVVKSIQDDISSSVVLEKTPVCDQNIIMKNDVDNLTNEKLSIEKIVSKEKTSESTRDLLSSSSSNILISNTLDIPVPSVDILDNIKIPYPSDCKKELNESKKTDCSVMIGIESKSKDKGDETAGDNKNVETPFFVIVKESHKKHDSIEDTVCPYPVEDTNPKVTTSRVKSVSRSRSRSKISKRSRKAERSKSRSRRESSSSRRTKSKDRSASRRSKSKEKTSNSRKGRSKSRDKRSRSKGRHSRSKERRRRSRERKSLSGSGRSRSKDKSSRLKDRRSRERRSRSRRRALSRSKRRSRSRDRSSKSRRRNRSRSRDKRSRSRDRRKRSRSHDKRSRSRGRRAHSRSRERRSRSRKHRGRSQSSRDKRSRSRTKKERSRSNSKDRSESKDKKSKKDRELQGSSKVKLYSRSKSSEKKSEVRSNSSDKKAKSRRERSKSTSKSSSKENEEETNNETNAVEKPESSAKTTLNVKSPIQTSNNVISANKKVFSRSKSDENRSSSSEKEMDTKTSSSSSSSEKSPDRSSKEKSPSPLSFSNNSVPNPSSKKRSNSVSKLITDNNSDNKKSKSPDTKLKRSRSKSPVTKPKRSRTKSPDAKPKRSRTKSPDSKTKRSRSKSRDKRKGKDKRTKSKDRSRSKEVKSKSSKARKSRSREGKSKTDEKSSKSQRKRSRTRSKSKDKTKSRDKRSRSRERRSKSRDKKSRRSRSRSRRRKSDKKERSRRTRSRSKSRTRKRSKKTRSRSRSKDEFFIDKSKLLEIARKNALSMMKQGAVGTDLNKVTAITAGGKTVDELTDFCKLLSQKDATGQESVSSESSSENESEKPFHHPFQLKERSNNIIMNIRNCASLPVKTHLEKTTENAQQLRLQFPVSSGQLHRKSENEWIPVSPKKTDELKAIMPAPLRKQEEELPAYPGLQETAHFSNIPLPNSIPHPQPHLPTVPQIGNPWPKPHDSGLFTGTTGGARFLSQAELASGQQAWAKKDQLICAQPVSGGMGMSLLQKMGWKPGEGLGKRNEGTLEPLKLQVKMDKRGLVCADEIPQPRFRPHHIPKNQPAKSLEGKHPVSLLVEYCTRKHFNPPMFTVLSEEGPAHKKNFVFKVTVNGVDYQPPNPSPNKKQAKSEAAVLCLRALGLLPTTS